MAFPVKPQQPAFNTVCANFFAISRTAGWTAEVLEQLEDNRLYRPHAGL